MSFKASCMVDRWYVMARIQNDFGVEFTNSIKWSQMIVFELVEDIWLIIQKDDLPQ